MTTAERWNAACVLLQALGGSAVVRTNKRGGCSADVYFRNQVDGVLGRLQVKSKSEQIGEAAIEAVTGHCAEKIEEHARRVHAALGAMLAAVPEHAWSCKCGSCLYGAKEGGAA